MASVTTVVDCADDGDWIEIVDNDDYEPAIEMFICGRSVGYVNLNADGIDALIVALAKSQDHDAETFGPLLLR